MAEFGNNNIETDGADDLSSVALLCSSGVFPANGTITAASIYISVAAGNIRLAIYSSAGDDPSSAVLEVDAGSQAASGSAWNTWSGLSVAVTSGVRYWIAAKGGASFLRYQGSLPAADWTLGSYTITGETVDAANAWDDPIATIVGPNTRGHSAYFTYTAAAASAAVTGTLSDNATEKQIRAGGETAVITLTGDTWVASGATFNAQRQAIIDGFDSGSSGTTGWNAEVRDKAPVTDVVRTSDTVVTVTFTAQAGYNISANETITVTVPAAALSGGVAVEATPTFDITIGDDSDITTDAAVRTGAGFVTFALRRIIRRYSG